MLSTLSADVLKALCLGAKAVGLGRAFMYANSVSRPRTSADQTLTPAPGLRRGGCRTYHPNSSARDSSGDASPGRHECERIGARDGTLFDLLLLAAQ